MGNQVASVEIRAQSRGLVAQLREAGHKFTRFADGVTSKLTGAFARLAQGKKGGFLGKGSFLGDSARTGMGNLMSSATQKGMDLFTDAAKSAFTFEEQLKRLQIAGNETPETMAAIAREVRAASDATGIGKDKILAGAAAYVRLTGDLTTAREQAGLFAKVAQATGSSVTDIADTAVALSQQLKVPAKDFEAMFSAMSIQGKAGAIELKDLSTELSTIAPQWAQFSKGTGAQGVRELGAALQVVKRGFGGDAAETTTGLSNFLTAIAKQSGRFKAGGVKSFFDVGRDGTKRLKDVFTIVDQISKSKLAKDDTALRKAFGSVEAYRAFIQLRDNRAELERIVDVSKDAGAIQRDFDTYMAGSTGRITKAWERVKNSIADAFTPERIEAFAGVLERAVGAVGPLLTGLTKVGEFLGGAYRVGQDLRGAGESLLGGVQIPKSRADLERMQDEAAYKRAGFDIVTAGAAGPFGIGGKAGETPESLALQYSSAQGPGAAAKRQAAQDFFKETGFTTPDMVTKQILAELKKINANTAAATEVKVGADPVAKAAKSAPSHRRQVAR